MVRSSEDVVAPASQEIWRLLWDPKVRGRVKIMKILIILFCLRSFYFLLIGIKFSLAYSSPKTLIYYVLPLLLETEFLALTIQNGQEV